jgi:hypothetical protein
MRVSVSDLPDSTHYPRTILLLPLSRKTSPLNQGSLRKPWLDATSTKLDRNCLQSGRRAEPRHFTANILPPVSCTFPASLVNSPSQSSHDENR